MERKYLFRREGPFDCFLIDTAFVLTSEASTKSGEKVARTSLCIEPDTSDGKQDNSVGERDNNGGERDPGDGEQDKSDEELTGACRHIDNVVL